MRLSPTTLSDQSVSVDSDWNYITNNIPEKSFLHIPLDEQMEKEKFKLSKYGFGRDLFKDNQYKLIGPPKPYFPPKIKKLLEKAKTRPLKDKEMIKLIDQIAEISVNFYHIQEGKYVAIGFDGRIVESSDTSLDLLTKIQGKKYSTQIFVWHVGSDVFGGWTS